MATILIDCSHVTSRERPPYWRSNFKMGKSFAQSYVESLTKEVCDSYITKLKKLIISKCPFEDKEFVDEPKTWPVVEYGDIYSYFVCTTSHYTNENMKAYKSLRLTTILQAVGCEIFL